VKEIAILGHLLTVFPAFAIGTYILLTRKGSARHRLLGKIYLALMFATAIFSLFIPAFVGPQFLSHFGFIHLLSVLAVYTVPTAYIAARNGQVRVHRGKMIGLYVGGLLLAGGLAMMPGRLMHTFLFT